VNYGLEAEFNPFPNAVLGVTKKKFYTDEDVWKIKVENQRLKFEIEELRRLSGYNTFSPQEIITSHINSRIEASIKADDCSAAGKIESQETITLLLEENTALKAFINNLNQEHDKYKKMAEELPYLKELINNLNQELNKRDEEIKVLRQEAGKPAANSGNSGMSPSKDLGHGYAEGRNDGSTGNPNKKSRGGQKGHPPHFRSPLDKDDADEIIEHKFEEGCLCPFCKTGVLVRDEEGDKSFEHNVKPEIKIIRQLHISCSYICPDCGKKLRKEAPKEIEKGGIFDVGFYSSMLYLKMLGAISLSKIQRFLLAELNSYASLSYINKCLKGATEILRPIYLELLDAVKLEKILNVDETGHKCKGKQLYTWVFCSPTLKVFRIATRAGCNLEIVLGNEYKGTLITDCYKVYISFAKNHVDVILQLCLQHLRRDFKSCTDWKYNQEINDYGKKGCEIIDKIFHHHHILKESHDIDSGCIKVKEELFILRGLQKELTEHAVNLPAEAPSKASGIAKRFREYPEYYFTFLDNFDVPPTNNFAEQTARGPVCDRKICFGTQSVEGNRQSEVFWTIHDTLRQRGLDVKPFIENALRAYWDGKPLPSLVSDEETVPERYVEQAKKEREELKQQKKRSC
jgi:hypothetical protein